MFRISWDRYTSITDLVLSGGFVVPTIRLILKNRQNRCRHSRIHQCERTFEIKQQLADNILWIKEAAKNKLVVGSQARILYADAEGRIEIAREFNLAVRRGIISAPIVIGRDHHDVSGY